MKISYNLNDDECTTFWRTYFDLILCWCKICVIKMSEYILFLVGGTSSNGYQYISKQDQGNQGRSLGFWTLILMTFLNLVIIQFP